MLPQNLWPAIEFVSYHLPVQFEGALERVSKLLEELGSVIEYATHVYDADETLDYLAGEDKARLGNINDAMRDPGIKAHA